MAPTHPTITPTPPAIVPTSPPQMQSPKSEREKDLEEALQYDPKEDLRRRVFPTSYVLFGCNSFRQDMEMNGLRQVLIDLRSTVRDIKVAQKT